jgi:hypothetical protein
MNWSARQGDVFIERLEGDEPETDPAPKDPRGLVLAEGETSGHYHSLTGAGCKLFRFRDTSGRLLMKVGKGGANVEVVGGGIRGVARHTAITLDKGTYVTTIQRAWTSEYGSATVED